jgi:hypothetical protein
MASKASIVQAVQIATIFTSATSTGLSLGFSLWAIPRLLESPVPLMLRQWSKMFIFGKQVMPPLALLSGVGFFYLAYNSWSLRSVSSKPSLYLVAGSLCVAFIPFTLILIEPTNQQLFAKLAESDKMLGSAAGTDTEFEMFKNAGGAQFGAKWQNSAKQLVDYWGTINVGRAGLLAVASVLALIAST